MFFRLSTWELWLIVAGLVLGFVAVGYLASPHLRRQAETLREPVGIVQGPSRARRAGSRLRSDPGLGRYDARGPRVIDDANTIGTT